MKLDIIRKKIIKMIIRTVKKRNVNNNLLNLVIDGYNLYKILNSFS